MYIKYGTVLHYPNSPVIPLLVFTCPLFLVMTPKPPTHPSRWMCLFSDSNLHKNVRRISEQLFIQFFCGWVESCGSSLCPRGGNFDEITICVRSPRSRFRITNMFYCGFVFFVFLRNIIFLLAP